MTFVTSVCSQFSLYALSMINRIRIYNNLFRLSALLLSNWFSLHSHCGIFFNLPLLTKLKPHFAIYWFNNFNEKQIANMSQTPDNTWSSTEAKENSQEISQLVSVHKCGFFLLFHWASASCTPLLDISSNSFFCANVFKVDNLSLKKEGDAKSDDAGVDVSKWVLNMKKISIATIFWYSSILFVVRLTPVCCKKSSAKVWSIPNPNWTSSARIQTHHFTRPKHLKNWNCKLIFVLNSSIDWSIYDVLGNDFIAENPNCCEESMQWVLTNHQRFR